MSLDTILCTIIDRPAPLLVMDAISLVSDIKSFSLHLSKVLGTSEALFSSGNDVKNLMPLPIEKEDKVISMYVGTCTTGFVK